MLIGNVGPRWREWLVFTQDKRVIGGYVAMVGWNEDDLNEGKYDINYDICSNVDICCEYCRGNTRFRDCRSMIYSFLRCSRACGSSRIGSFGY